MQKRNTQQRRDAIVAWVNENGHVPVEFLVEHFGTSAVTIRKDLAQLAQQGRLVREFGGAAPIPFSDNRPTPRLSSQKQAIGRLAASLVQNGHHLVLDCGSTTTALLPYLTNHQKLVVMTNALGAAQALTAAENEPTVLMTGGTWDPTSQSFQGKMAEKMIEAYSFDWAFVGASGLDIQRGTTTLNELTGLSQAMARAAARVVVMAESAKLHQKMPNLELPWSAIDILVTDHNLSAEHRHHIEQQGVTVMQAASDGE
ncbi:DeoR/GlpR transcriptional regulator [Alteromonas aestuariivivens]|uniref:DeoR/GlpR transcriptional regulator n=1 Tax=Alteromonas aestuariivivens TaxID=1938339 RepID=A0A3D8MBP5_9ALTE|nr:DeoR/GlpR family DNA-binding transcription regulator [Alteromonas aestuariivivens]RDV26832.1 DeoR/GlpR transcriptional regulator [Alteromonas aestuariivivens]